MGQTKPPSPVKLIVGTLTAKSNLLESVYQRLSEQFGPIDFTSQFFPFDYTNYYEPEMGKELKRQFISFQRLIVPDKLASVKLFSNAVEDEYVIDETRRRRVNLDPGYISAAKLVSLQQKIMRIVSISSKAFTLRLRSGFSVKPFKLGIGLTLITARRFILTLLITSAESI